MRARSHVLQQGVRARACVRTCALMCMRASQSTPHPRQWERGAGVTVTYAMADRLRGNS